MKTRLAFFTLAAIVGVSPTFGQSIDGLLPGKPRALEEQRLPLGKDDARAQPNFAAENLRDLPTHLPTSWLSAIARRPLSEATEQTRSAKDAQIYRSVSPSVVLVLTEKGLGSGSLIGPNEVLTNWHVVTGHADVAVVFKPATEGQAPTKADMLTGRVVKHDEVADLALIKVAGPPALAQVLRLGDSSEISVGLDVHAIGHPQSATWTYTKGIISQYRLGFEWQGDDRIKHKADVIQTQTPINPGNSGGPLVGESGTLIGVNSFKAAGGEGLNFAVSIDDVKKFIARSGDRIAEARRERSGTPDCKPKEVSRWRTKEKDAIAIGFDLICTGKIDAVFTYPDDLSRPVRLDMDRNHDGRFDVAFFGNRDSRWMLSFWDGKFDGRWSLVGYHDDGRLKPTRYESYEAYRKRLAARLPSIPDDEADDDEEP
jgi:S1-C subfamily serine protease